MRDRKGAEAMPDALGEALRQTAERLFDGRNYSHAPIWRQIKDLSAEQALWRPSPERHCVWEIVRHVAFWKRHFMDSLAGRPTAPLDEDWRLPPRTDAAAWAAELDDFAALQRAWVETYGTFTRQALLTPDSDGRFERFAQVIGYLEHEAYHTGQIAYLQALMGLPSVE
ncbi:DinB family protein [Geochorda subterranea]|uniref:DinB family protein n=1 Tax=Geochorda subterranea TaxID=3109564 RepID=A0ABZ1BMM2_9FIRM|nr:DinB family protein [Limnochorda sp. LNt]WRP13815.1 DinB family protein [Limnochorda sp. LNt]